MNLNAIKSMNDTAHCAESKGCAISYVIVNWNAKQYLRDCLLSLLIASRDIDYEIIVIDNASSDGSWQMIQDEFPQVKLIRNTENLGFAKANNQGIEIACGRYVCLVNSDVLVLPRTIEFLLNELETNPKIGIIGPKVLNSDLTLQRSCRNFPTVLSALFRALKLDTTFPQSRLFGRYQMTYWNCDDIRKVDILSGCFWLIRRKALEQVGLLDTRFYIYGEDMDFCRRFPPLGWDIVFNPGAKIIHYGGASSANAPARFWIEMQRADLKYWYKYHGRLLTYVYYSFLILHNIVRGIGFGVRLFILSKDNSIAQAGMIKSKKSLKWLMKIETLNSVAREEL